MVGGHRWHLRYYPNGYDSECAGFVSLCLFPEDDSDDDEDENDDDWEANEVDETDNDDDDEDDDYEDEDDDEYHQDEHSHNDEAHADDMAEDDEDDDCEDEDHEDEHINNDEALDDDMAEDDDHDYRHKLVPSVKAQVFFCFIDQFQWLRSGLMRETIIHDFDLETGLVYRGIIKKEMLERSTHLKDDSFTIRCDIVVLNVKSKDGASTLALPFIHVPPSDMPIHFKDLLLSKEGADVTFVVDDETFSAHCCIIAA